MDRVAGEAAFESARARVEDAWSALLADFDPIETYAFEEVAQTL